MENRESENHPEQEAAFINGGDTNETGFPGLSSDLAQEGVPIATPYGDVDAPELTDGDETPSPGSGECVPEDIERTVSETEPVAVLPATSRWYRLGAFILGMMLIAGTLFFSYRMLLVPSSNMDVVLYFSDFTHHNTVVVRREIPRTNKYGILLRRLMMELCYGPLSNSTLPSIPSGTRLLGSWYRDGIAYVDFSKELYLALPVEGGAERIAVGAILATIKANMPAVKRVQILVNGRVRYTLRGLTRIDQPLVVHHGLVIKQ